MVLAALVIVLHLGFGLGFLWPVAALAAWGAGALLTPPDRGDAKAVPGAANAELGERHRPNDPGELRRALDRDVRRWERDDLSDAVTDALTGVYSHLSDALDKWDRLADSARHRVIVQTIVTDDLPDVMDGFLAVPRGDRALAEGDVVSLLGLLGSQAEQAVEEARAASDGELRELEQKRLRVEMQYGKLPDLPEPSAPPVPPAPPAPPVAAAPPVPPVQAEPPVQHEPASAPDRQTRTESGTSRQTWTEPVPNQQAWTEPVPNRQTWSEPASYEMPMVQRAPETPGPADNPFDPTANLPPITGGGEPWDAPRKKRSRRSRGDADGA